jgi:hypothetical protein
MVCKTPLYFEIHPGVAMDNKHIQELKDKIEDLKKRWPAHSVPPAMLQKLDDLEDELLEALGQPATG